MQKVKIQLTSLLDPVGPRVGEEEELPSCMSSLPFNEGLHFSFFLRIKAVAFPNFPFFILSPLLRRPSLIRAVMLRLRNGVLPSDVVFDAAELLRLTGSLFSLRDV